MTWGLIWLMLVLKIPVAALLYLVWWAVHQDVEPENGGADGGDGGTKVHPRPDHRPRRPRPTRPRGPHGEPQPPAPKRARTTAVRSRERHKI
jgi:hypothetical protein